MCTGIATVWKLVTWYLSFVCMSHVSRYMCVQTALKLGKHLWLFCKFILLFDIQAIPFIGHIKPLFFFFLHQFLSAFHGGQKYSWNCDVMMCCAVSRMFWIIRKHLTETNWATSREHLFMPYANNKGADQPAHLRNQISAFVNLAA